MAGDLGRAVIISVTLVSTNGHWYILNIFYCYYYSEEMRYGGVTLYMHFVGSIPLSPPHGMKTLETFGMCLLYYFLCSPARSYRHKATELCT